MDALLRYSWPGNIRELRNVIERSVIRTTGTTLALSIENTPANLSTNPPVAGRKLLALVPERRVAENEHLLSTPANA